MQNIEITVATGYNEPPFQRVWFVMAKYVANIFAGFIEIGHLVLVSIIRVRVLKRVLEKR
ncbi:hypothetical protein RhiirA4_466344 [Rhizophagus irregularis]|uniref:Uncharacterized protein n=1 Tax=Rhizophagus irregularis TaxID=588596 RepID=A0A2I1GTU9_9GLOM|nr:hypothetical protein RhiirA4_466344 [Rhizophagus irregularis]